MLEFNDISKHSPKLTANVLSSKNDGLFKQNIKESVVQASCFKGELLLLGDMATFVLKKPPDILTGPLRVCHKYRGIYPGEEF